MNGCIFNTLISSNSSCLTSWHLGVYRKRRLALSESFTIADLRGEMPVTQRLVPNDRPEPLRAIPACPAKGQPRYIMATKEMEIWCVRQRSKRSREFLPYVVKLVQVVIAGSPLRYTT